MLFRSDADESWLPDAGGAGLKDVLGGVPAGVAAVTVARDNFPIVPTAVPESSPFFDRLTWRETQSVQALGRTWRVLHQALRDGRLPEEFRRQNPDGAESESQVAAGRLVQDLRLRNALRSLRAASKLEGP